MEMLDKLADDMANLGFATTGFAEFHGVGTGFCMQFYKCDVFAGSIYYDDKSKKFKLRRMRDDADFVCLSAKTVLDKLRTF